jgi:thiol-disulfide isomerase/thioredoxin
MKTPLILKTIFGNPDKMNKTVQILLIASLALFFSACNSSDNQDEIVFDQASLLVDIEPGEISGILEKYKGEKVVLLNVWATWCAPCVEEFPYITRIQREYADDVHVVFISADFEEDRERAIRFLEDHNVNWESYFKLGRDEDFIDALSPDWRGSLPFTQIISKNGEIVNEWIDKAEFEFFESQILEALNQ